MDVTLTFDNGPDAQATPAVLDTLERFDVASAFFLVGSKLDKRGNAIARAALERRYLLDNHTWSHSGPLGERTQPGPARAEITRTQERLEHLGSTTRLFRPVGGDEGGIIDQRLLNGEALDTLLGGEYSLVL